MKRPLPVIDADGHITETEEQVRAYMDEPYRSCGATFLAGGSYWDRSLGGRLGQEARDVETWIQVMDRGGMETAALFGSRMAFNISLIWEPDVAVAVSRAYNQFVYEEAREASITGGHSGSAASGLLVTDRHPRRRSWPGTGPPGAWARPNRTD